MSSFMTSAKTILAGVMISGFALQAWANGPLVDLGDNGTRTGHAMQSEQNQDGTTRVHAYDWICPVDYYRPDDGRATLEFSAGQCVERTTLQIISVRQQTKYGCYPITSVKRVSEDPDIYMSEVELGERQCIHQKHDSVAEMFKQYRRGYYVVAGQAGDLENQQQDSGGSGAAAAAKAAGAAAGGIYDSCSDNPFGMCSGPRPDKKNPLRACFDFLCKFGK